MTDRWRDKKNEPGFVFHAWMRTVDDLQDQKDELRDALSNLLNCVDGVHDYDWLDRVKSEAKTVLAKAGQDR